MKMNWKYGGHAVLWLGLIVLGAFLFLNLDLAHRKRELYLIFGLAMIFMISGWVGVFRFSRIWNMIN
jgi:hypothetical protein